MLTGGLSRLSLVVFMAGSLLGCAGTPPSTLSHQEAQRAWDVASEAQFRSMLAGPSGTVRCVEGGTASTTISAANYASRRTVFDACGLYGIWISGKMEMSLSGGLVRGELVFEEGVRASLDFTGEIVGHCETEMTTRSVGSTRQVQGHICGFEATSFVL